MIKLYVLTGFLGAGKTTLLRHLLEGMPGKQVGVIQNEFGKLSIDGDILRSGEITMVEITRGSIFCSCLKLNFVQALAAMADQGLEYLFVESSGLADPSNLEEILEAAAVLRGGSQPYVLSGTLCLCDGVDFLRDVEAEETVRRQVIHCNIAVINKRDLIDDRQAEDIRRAIGRLNSSCLVVETVNGRIDPALLEQDVTGYAWAACEDSTNTAETKPKTFSLELEGDVPLPALTAFLEAVLPQCYRIKGFCKADGRWQQVDVVGDRIDFAPGEEQDKSRLVFISRTGIQLIRDINRSWQDHVGLPVKLHN